MISDFHTNIIPDRGSIKEKERGVMGWGEEGELYSFFVTAE